MPLRCRQRGLDVTTELRSVVCLRLLVMSKAKWLQLHFYCIEALDHMAWTSGWIAFRSVKRKAEIDR